MKSCPAMPSARPKREPAGVCLALPVCCAGTQMKLVMSGHMACQANAVVKQGD